MIVAWTLLNHSVQKDNVVCFEYFEREVRAGQKKGFGGRVEWDFPHCV